MKIHSWEEVIRYFLDKGYKSYLWDYVTALRSGDDVDDIWKIMITCLIRGEGLNGMAWDISWCKDYLDDHESDDCIEEKLNETFKDISSHYINHSQRGFDSLSIYYRDVIKNKSIAISLKELSRKMKEDRKEIPKIVSSILNILYKND